jgi:hypothetical protein
MFTACAGTNVVTDVWSSSTFSSEVKLISPLPLPVNRGAVDVVFLVVSPVTAHLPEAVFHELDDLIKVAVFGQVADSAGPLDMG